MPLESVHLSNYRCYRDFTLDLRSGFNALVGVNGCGKTSILNGIVDGLAVAMNGGNGGLDEGVIRLEVQRQGGRIYFAPQYPMEILLNGSLLGQEFSLSRFKASNIDSYGSKGRLATPWEEEGGSRPLIAFYRASRNWSPTSAKSELAAASVKPTRADGYGHWHDAAASAGALQVWAIAKCLERFQVSSETGMLFDEILTDDLALVNQALAKAVPEIRGLRYDMKEKCLLVDLMEGILPFDYLSDGQKSVIGLVVDIARRMCLLNPSFGPDVTSRTEGIVLVDELDLHLHPGWQRSLTIGLKSAFPRLQFIVTSHSPQILGELRPDEILLLRPEGGDHPQISYGLDSSTVLEVLMGTPPRSSDVAAALSLLFARLEGDDVTGVRLQIEDLRRKAPGLAELTRADALLKRKEILGR